VARGTPAALALGPGYLYISDDLTCTEPSDLVTAWATVDTDWKTIGYTDDGSEFKYSLSTDTVEVAEELDPISNQTTGRASSLTFAMAEVTATHLMYAMNAPTTAITAGTGIVTFEPPDLGSEQRRKLGWQSEDGQERWVFRQCFQTGDTTISRSKGAAKATISVEFTLEKPTSGAKLFKAIMVSPGRA
jgi:hypothetical protein